MKTSVVAFLFCLAALLPLSAAGLAQSATTCSIDDQIPAERRAAIEAAGLSFVNAVLAGRPDQAYASFTADTKAHMTADSFAQMVAGARQSFQGVQGLHVGHAYLVAVP